MTSRRIFRLLTGMAVIPAMGWLFPAVLWCQLPAASGATLYASVTPADLELKAADLCSDPATFGQAGDLFEQAARMLPVEAAQSVDLLVRAARLQYWAGALTRARTNMKEAGWRALGQGQVRRAANAYADAALIAAADKDEAGVVQLAKIVQLLAKWPGVTPAESRQIRSRIN